MSSPRKMPSISSLTAFVLVVSPFLYVLSYAPVVRVSGRTVWVSMSDVRVVRWHGITTVMHADMFTEKARADSSLYPIYQPVDWLIDHTPLQTPLFWWATQWGVRGEFEEGRRFRSKIRASADS